MSKRFPTIKPCQINWQKHIPYCDRFDDVYFSKDNGFEESLHVFVEGNDLIKRWQEHSDNIHKPFVIGETGFGSGLNFLVTYYLWQKYAPKKAELHYISCELYPWGLEDFQKALSLWPDLKEIGNNLIRQYPKPTPGTHTLNFPEDRIKLTIMMGDAQSCYGALLICGHPTTERKCRTSYVDAWFLDGFAPAKNESMWTDSLFETLALLSKPKQTTFATFTCARAVRDGLTKAGFSVKKIKGYGRKKEMTIGNFEQTMPYKSQIKKETPWHFSPATSYQSQKALIIGGGLAGSYCAYELEKRGWQTTIVEKNSNTAQGGSGNDQSLLFPKFSSYKAPFTEWMLTAYLYALNAYRPLLADSKMGYMTSLLQHADEKQSLEAFFDEYPMLGVLLNPQQGSRVAGVKIDKKTLHITNSAVINMPKFCKYLIEKSNCKFIPNLSVTQLVQENNLWKVAGIGSFDVIIIANSYQANIYEQTNYLKFRPIRGQMTKIHANSISQNLKVPICGNGHILPAHQGHHALGATYFIDNDDSKSTSHDNHLNLQRLNQLIAEGAWSDEVTADWAGVRAATPDYLPFVGPVTNAKEFNNNFACFSKSAQYWVPSTNPVYAGLYVCAGFGSRGLTSIPLAAQYLTNLITGEFQTLPRHLAQAISPARFLRKAITRNNLTFKKNRQS